MSSAIDRVHLEALENYRSKIVVLKFGGSTSVDPALQRAFAADIAVMRDAGVRPVVIHGGGPQISKMLDRLGIESSFIGGFRVTTPEVMQVVRMVLVGEVQRNLVNDINAHGPLAVGLSGEDAHLLTAQRRTATVDSEPIDIGLVGDVNEVNTAFIESLLDQQLVPVVSGIGRGADGCVYNLNADTAASALAVSLKAERLVMLTDVAGLYADWPATDRLLSTVNALELEKLLPSLASGMVPKMEACLRAVKGGVDVAHVVDGRVAHGALMSLTLEHAIGTTVTE